jgi:branched-subunit amino acid aminotransferase/4-amino-4-deoxychorismate lyase
MEAQKKAADEVLFLNQHQHLTSASCANVFIVKNAILYTPLLTDGILPGITRQILLTIAAGKQIKAIEKSITLSELLQADEVFITNSLIIIKPIVKINTQLIAHGKKGHLTSLLQKYFVEYINNLHS